VDGHTAVTLAVHLLVDVAGAVAAGLLVAALRPPTGTVVDGAPGSAGLDDRVRAIF
jgi:hypothetical protein